MVGPDISAVTRFWEENPVREFLKQCKDALVKLEDRHAKLKADLQTSKQKTEESEAALVSTKRPGV